MNFEQFGNILMSGLTNGAIYALLALGFTVVFSISRILNLLVGEFVILGGLLTIWLTDVPGLGVLAAAPVAIVFTTGAALVFENLALSKRRLSADASLIITLGGAFIFRGIAMIWFGKDTLSLPAFSGEEPILVGSLAISTQTIWICATLALSAVLLWWFFGRTYTGKAMLACSENPVGAQLVGIDRARMARISFGMSAAIGALAGIVVAPTTFMSFDGGLPMSVEAFVAAVLGSLGSYPGAVVGGLVLGLLEAVAAGYLSSELKSAIAFSGVLLVLFVRPNGIVGAAK